MGLRFYAVCFFVFMASHLPVYGQSYGLGFAGHEVVQDKRTGLDLSMAQPICLSSNFELSFDFSFMPGYADYFGYIFRLIDQDKRNIDLVYDMRFQENKHFKLIIGDKISDIAFDIDINQLYKNWYKLQLKFDIAHQQLVLTADGKSYRQSVPLKANCYKILLGANNYKGFSIKDVPPMKIREVKITEGKKLNFYWPLNENNGLKAAERVEGKDADVANPIWIRKLHHDWALAKSFVIKGAASVAMNAGKEELYIVSEDSLAVLNITSSQLAFKSYHSGKQRLLRGNQAVYVGARDQLLNFYMDQRLMTGFNFKDQTWDKHYTYPDIITVFWHPNKFYSPADSSLYMIGGYGQYTYKRSVHRYHFPDKTWSTVAASGDFTPRYLAALGAAKGGAYILGGYGSSTGEQILNPRNIYDLNFYDIEHKSFKKLFELNPGGKGFAFANAMVIDEKAGSYYALTFPNDKYNSALQMIRGSLHSPSYTWVGNSIPYAFHDINSFADLYYCPANKRFVAVTLLYDEKRNQTAVKIYTLYGPPEDALMAVSEMISVETRKYLLLLFSVLLAAALLLYRLIKNRGRNFAPLPVDSPVILFPADKTMEHEISETEPSPAIVSLKEVKNAVFLFGDLQLFDRDGKDMTKLLSPLIRELFLVVLLHTIKWGRGISSEKLAEILWFDKSQESARNNRSVNIAKLKIILDKMDGCQISKQTGYWTINFESTIAIDYYQYLHIVGSKREIDKQRINELTAIVQRGSFLSNLEYDWLDDFKSEISNEIIDTCLHYAATLDIADDPEFLIHLTNHIFYFDPVNEEAMVIKCKALVYLGKHSLAKTRFETFKKDYKAIYGEDFRKSFQDILE